MSNEDPQGFVRSKLPWIVGAGALVFFLITLNQWVSLRSLAMVSRVAGGDMEIPMTAPVTFLLTLPFQLFPAGIQPVALNVFTALCGALTVALLARSVALLPHDRTHEQRIRERSEYSFLSIPLAWAPVALACGALAFQLTYWEHATSVTGEARDLLMFAYVIRCLLEYRIAHEERWLSKMALVYGMAVTNNWAMMGFFPGFLGAVIWIKGIRFFDPGFLVRMVLLGLAGLSMYLLLPLVWVMKGGGEYTFFEVLRTNWNFQKMYLAQREFRNNALLLSLTSVLPVILMGVRWRTSVGDVNAAGSFLTTLAFRIVNLFFLGVCVWIVFDPQYSPRALSEAKSLGLTFLTFYYLGALAIGYYSGYALLVFTEAPRKGRFRDSSVGKVVNPVVRFAVLAAVLLVPAGLIYRNFAAVRGDNGVVLKEFAAHMAESLPPSPAYLLGDDPYALSILQLHLGAEGKAPGYVFVSTRFLETPAYHFNLREKYGERWPLLGTKEELGERIPQPEIQLLVKNLASSNVVAYIQPSFGYFFEMVHSSPNGQSYRLAPFTEEQVLPPALEPEQIQANEAYWAKSGEYIQSLKTLKEDSLDARFAAHFYSRGLNTWGVALQRAGKVAEAGKQFELAYELNTNNLPARVNGKFNRGLQSGKAEEKTGDENAEEKDMFGGYRSWDRLLAENGPFDQPEYCHLLGVNLLSQAQYRQAALQLSRTITFQPTNFHARISYVKSLLGGPWAELAMAELDRISNEFLEMSADEKVELANARASAYFNKNEFARAEETLLKMKEAMPEKSAVSEALFELYRAAGRYTNALAVIDQQLARTPTNGMILLQKAELQLSHRDFAGTHETLDKVLAQDPKGLEPQSVTAQLYHAFAYIQERRFDQALAAVEPVLREDSENTQALLYKGIAHMEKKELDEAREAFDDLLAEQPENHAALRNRAILHLRAERWSEAKDDYEELRKSTPKSHAVMYGLGEIAYNEKKREEALRYYEAYLKYAPEQGGAELEEEKKKVRERMRELSTPGK